ncbi:hypothetical protein WJM97_11490 [Okeanomitos corallinicola TIOX110]|uniref:Uncharacterized protein n=1 Tax=Okeanomitos corallinicola TIOX110 TaxID=3133117 RepID=A0ABZ2ULJ8_9CYAN
MIQQVTQVLMVATLSLTGFVAGNFLLSWNQKKLKKERQGENFTTFMTYFSEKEVPENVCFQVYSYLQNSDIKLHDFPIRPTDDLGKVYGICEEDLDEAVLEIARNCGCPILNINNNRELTSVKTVEDLVRFLINFQRVI